MVAVGGSNAIDAVVAMEARGIKVELGTLKRQTQSTLLEVNYMIGAKSTIACLERQCRELKRSMFWRWHIIHPENTNWVAESRSMHLLPKGHFRCAWIMHLQLSLNI